MFQILSNRTYRHLFLAQVIALLGTGLATVALGLLAYDLAGANAGAVLGTALAIKMLAYIGVAPVAAAFAERLPRRTMLVSLDVVRAGVALLLPFVDQIWQIYVLIFVLQSASAAFTPTFQATIPDVLPDEKDYTQALSLSRLAYDMESLVSPALAALLLSVVSYHSLFNGTVVGFLASAALVISAMLPRAKLPPKRSIYERTTRGLRIYLRTPRLRGLLALNLAIAAGSAMVIVNTVVLVQAGLGLNQKFTAMALAAFGAGSMLVALALPKILDKLPERRVMLVGGTVIAASLLVGGVMPATFSGLLALWFLVGVGYSLAQTPSGRLLRRSSHAVDRPALFAAQFALSHTCWLLTYPLAGWLGAKLGMSTSFLSLGAVALVAIVLASRLWPSHEAARTPHDHPGLSVRDPHLEEHRDTGGAHSHEFIVDDQHPRWPS